MRSSFPILRSCAVVAVCLACAPAGRAAQLMTRTLKEKPAIVVAAFGTSTKAQVTYDVFERQLREELPGYEVRWAFTSEIIRERVNERLAREGSARRLLSLQQVLSNLQADGYTRAVVQPLQIFPGEEYEEVVRIATGFPGLRIELSETLLHRWDAVREVVGILSKDFLPPQAGCNVIVAHGSPQTAVGSNSTYLGLERDLTKRFPNVSMGCVEGVLTREDGLEPAKACRGNGVRLIPLMFVGGDHVMNDVMGDGDSWRGELERAGKTVDVPTMEVNGSKQFRGLGLIPDVNRIFIRALRRALARL